jgi:hypothetical protein
MQRFPIYTIESAPEQSKAALQNLKAAFGMVPNIAGAMATSPVLINSLVGLFQRVHGGSFTEAQIQNPASHQRRDQCLFLGGRVPYRARAQGRARSRRR